MAKRLYGNNSATITTASLASGATTVDVDSVTTFPTITGSDWFIATLDDGTNIEVVKATALSTLTYTITRAQEGTTSPASFAAGTKFEIRETKGSFDDILVNLGVTTTVAELNYVDGVTSAIQTQLDDKLDTSSLGTGQAAFLAQNVSLVDPNADRIIFWDDSAGEYTHLTPGSGLSISGSTLNAIGLQNATMSFISSQTASASASLNFTDLGDYSFIMFVLDNILPTTDDVELWCRTSTNNGSSYDAGASDYSWTHRGRTGATSQDVSSADSKIVFNQAAAGLDISNATGEGFTGVVRLFNPNAASQKTIDWQGTFINANGNSASYTGGGKRVAAADVDAIQFLFSNSSTIASGTIYAYGVLKSGAITSGLSDGDFGDATVSGSGTLITVDLPAQVTPASDDKIYLFDTSASNAKKYCLVSDIGGGIAANSFMVHRTTAITMTQNVFVRITLNSEDWDTGGFFDSTTNSRFQPTIAGKYTFIGQVAIAGMTAGNKIIAELRKNNVSFPADNINVLGGSADAYAQVAGTVSLNGSTDYVDLYGFTNQAGLSSVADVCFLTGWRIE